MIITIILVIISAISNACMDVVWNNFNSSIFFNINNKWFDPHMSWLNKWNWWPTKLGKFLLSTIFVFITDFWHLCKLIMLVCYSLAIALNVNIFNNIIETFVLYCLFTCTFELFWSKFLIKKK